MFVVNFSEQVIQSFPFGISAAFAMGGPTLKREMCMDGFEHETAFAPS